MSLWTDILRIVLILRAASVLGVLLILTSCSGSGTLTITADTTLTEDHVGAIVIAADNIGLDCAGYQVIGDGSGDGILLQDRTGVHIEDCTVTNFEVGFRLDESPSNTLTQNTALLNRFGFFFTSSPSNELVQNTASNNSSSGFDFRNFSGSAILTENLAMNNNGGGFGIAQSSNMTLTRNTAAGSTLSIGFSFSATGSNILEQNVATDNNVGFVLWGPDNLLHQNLAAENFVGFSLSSVFSSTLTENTASENVSGFSFVLARGNTLIGNTTIDNQNGFVLDVNSDAPNNLFVHNNIIGNSSQVLLQAAVADWYDPVLLEGNFWSDYTGLDDGSGSGKHAIAGDGIGDTHIPHPGAGFDNYPFVEAFDNPLATGGE